MSVYRVLDKLEAYVHEGTWLPAGYRVLSEERLIEFVEKIRATLPEEVGRAKIIAKDQDRVIRAAQEKAQAIVDQASNVLPQLNAGAIKGFAVTARERLPSAPQVPTVGEAGLQPLRKRRPRFSTRNLDAGTAFGIAQAHEGGVHVQRGNQQVGKIGDDRR